MRHIIFNYIYIYIYCLCQGRDFCCNVDASDRKIKACLISYAGESKTILCIITLMQVIVTNIMSYNIDAGDSNYNIMSYKLMQVIVK